MAAVAVAAAAAAAAGPGTLAQSSPGDNASGLRKRGASDVGVTAASSASRIGLPLIFASPDASASVSASGDDPLAVAQAGGRRGGASGARKVRGAARGEGGASWSMVDGASGAGGSGDTITASSIGGGGGSGSDPRNVPEAQ